MTGTFKESGQGPHVVGAENYVDPRCFLEDDIFIFLGETPSDGDLHPLVLLLHRCEVSEISVQLVVRVLTHGAGVDHHHIRSAAHGPHIACRFE